MILRPAGPASATRWNCGRCDVPADRVVSRHSPGLRCARTCDRPAGTRRIALLLNVFGVYDAFVELQQLQPSRNATLTRLHVVSGWLSLYDEPARGRDILGAQLDDESADSGRCTRTCTTGRNDSRAALFGRIGGSVDGCPRTQNVFLVGVQRGCCAAIGAWPPILIGESNGVGDVGQHRRRGLAD